MVWIYPEPSFYRSRFSSGNKKQTVEELGRSSFDRVRFLLASLIFCQQRPILFVSFPYFWNDFAHPSPFPSISPSDKHNEIGPSALFY